MDDRFASYSASTKIANDFAEYSCVATGNKSVGCGFQLQNNRRGEIARQLFVKRSQIGALGTKHLVPFFPRRAGSEARFGFAPSGGKRACFASLDEQMSCAAEDYFA